MSTNEERVTAMLGRLADFAQVDAPVRTAPRGAGEPEAGANRRRRYPLAVACLAVIVVAGSLVVLASRGGHGSRTVSTSGGTVSVLPKAPIAARADAVGVWTGTELLIWGGFGGGGTFADGAGYNPRLGRWEVMASAPISARADAAAVWTGSELVVWGGYANGSVRPDGAAYNPATHRWRMIAGAPIAGLTRPATIWTGSEMIVVGGINGPEQGAAYNPATNAWRIIATPPGTTPVPYPQAVWTGTTALFIRDLAPAAKTPPTATSRPATPNSQTPIGPPPTIPHLPTPGLPNSNLTLVAYDPNTDSWTNVADGAIGNNPWLVWTGAEALLLAPSVNGQNRAYTPSTHAWRVLSAPASSVIGTDTAGAGDDSPVWSGRQVLFWHGGTRGVTYDPGSDTWQHFDAGNLPARSNAAVAWTGDTLLGWGGGTDGAPTFYADGISIRPT